MKLSHFVFIILSLSASQTTFSQGLKFYGGDHPINERTSYNVFSNKSPEFSGYFDIEFDLSLYPARQIGYIIRIKNEDSNKIFNLFYDGQGGNHIFKLNEEGRSSLITAEIGREELMNAHWFKMIISFDLKKDSIKFTIHDKTFAAGDVRLSEKYRPVIVFGKSDHVIDVPSFAIKDLSVGNSRRYIFELRESEGNFIYDIKGKRRGDVLNPEWLINDSYHWRFKAAFGSETVAGANYNAEKKEIYYFNKDSIIIYNVRTGDKKTEIFKEPCPIKLVLGSNFIETKNNELFVYEVFYDLDKPYDGPSVASLDLSTYEWTVRSNHRLPRQLHHHASYIDPSTGRYTIFGGFGNMYYNKDFYYFDSQSEEWHQIEGLEGDPIFPRYFSSVGYLDKTKSVYVFGGMGNESGEQVVGRRYFYDLHKVDLSTKRVEKLWEIQWDKDYIVPVRGMVILNDSCFYTLCYPESFSDSFLQLYRFSLTDGSYEILGDSIPIHSDKITTNANLYYDNQLHSLYALVQEFDDDIVSDLKIYSLAFPPITAEDLASYPKGKNDNTALRVIIISCVCVTAIVYFFFRRFNSKYGNNRNESGGLQKHSNESKEVRANSIYLFGDFTVRDKRGKDITYMLSTRLKQVLFLVLQHSVDNGITSQRLSSLLWPGKPEDKVKNSRGVTINHLRKVLSELDGIELIYDKGYFRIVQTSDFYCDYERCINIISTNKTEENKAELVRILTRGKFLKSSDHPLFDSFKEEVEQRIEPVLLSEMEKSYDMEDYRSTICFAEAIFNIDALNDDALIFQTRALKRLKMDDEARIRYQAFIIEYKKAMGKDYHYSYKDLN
ncbi:hypothetical protein [Prevotella sp. 10(H)]|uniref:Kelch repeat-containing protein n=1 Tax=Prevotella sp. 10(H) TaxID=1158294 RepID=UPI0004A75081|nr:hypothetical protein [Prevotella sp. 10(H)]